MTIPADTAVGTAVESTAKPQGKPQGNPRAKTGKKPVKKPVKPVVKTETESKVESKVESKGQSKGEVKKDGKKTNKAHSKPTSKSQSKPTKSTDKLQAKPQAKPAGKSTGKLTKSAGKSTGKPPGKPPGKSNGKPNSKPADKKPVGKEANGKTSKPNSKPAKATTDAKPTTTTETSDEPLISKMSQLKQLVKTTSEVQLRFKTMNEYLQYFTYNLFLEELFETEVCPEVELVWDKEDPMNCTIRADMNTLFDYYVDEKMRHLKKHPFASDQPIFIMRKSEMGFEGKPEIWATYVSNRAIMQRAKGGKLKKKFTKNAVVKKDHQKAHIDLRAFDWNEKPLPIGENGKGFAILPGSNVIGRVMSGMGSLTNPFFKSLLLGNEPVKKVKFHNKLNYVSGSLNDSQKEAIQTALNNRVTILKGPPGSGKTSTIYELIMQLLNQFNSYPILVVAASNLAVDNIAEKLMAAGHEKDLLRITSITKESEYGLGHHLGGVCLHNKISQNMSDKCKDIQRRLRMDRKSVSSSEFNKYMDETMAMGTSLVNNSRVILSTTVGIGGPYLKNLKELPVIIMDEATQSSEPASLIPLAARGCKRIIFVGDEKQLSAFTRVAALEMSLFERVLKNGVYSSPCMLNTQYRMHPKISQFPRKVFYGGELLDGVTSEDRALPGVKYPLFFLNCVGRESREFTRNGEEFGFSWGNRGEVAIVERFIEKLICMGVKRSDIGVMTGYSAQREMITRALEGNLVINPEREVVKKKEDKEDLGSKASTTCYVNGVIVSTVDAFQGREKKFVIMSCVRSNPRCEVGFLKDYRRMNVAFTRAQNSFIMIGDAETLAGGDDMWRGYIDELREGGLLKESINEY